MQKIEFLPVIKPSDFYFQGLLKSTLCTLFLTFIASSTLLFGTSTPAGFGDGTGAGRPKPNACTAAIDTLYVDGSIATPGRGVSWASPFKYLQDALDYANDCSHVKAILVARGIYKPATTTPANAENFTFFVGGDYSVIGGYPSGGGIQDHTLNPTVLDGQLSSSIYAYHIMVVYNSTANISGFRFRNGKASGTSSFFSGKFFVHRGRGGALVAKYSLVNLTNCVLYNNEANSDGGAFLNDTSEVKIVNTIFANNSAGLYGGAISMRDYARLYMTNSTLFGNRVDSSYQGAAIYTENVPTFQATNSIFWGNLAGGQTNNFNNTGMQTISFSIVQGGNYSFSNLPQDPKFHDVNNLNGLDDIWFTKDDGLSLMPCSPAVNTGHNWAANTPILDITGRPRRAFGRVDRGAYELQSDILSTIDLATNFTYDSIESEGADNIFTGQLCDLIAVIGPQASDTFTGLLIASVYINPEVNFVKNRPYVSRSYLLRSNSASETNPDIHHVTIFFKNAEFVQYNNTIPGCTKLPTSSTGSLYVPNLRVIQSHGDFFNNVPSPSILKYIDPIDTDIQFANGIWSVTFDVDSLEQYPGFYITAEVDELPIYYYDLDNDGFGSMDSIKYACAGQPSGTKRLNELNPNSTGQDDCNDLDDDEFPGQVWGRDKDRDGYTNGSTDVACTRLGPNWRPLSETLPGLDCDDNDSLEFPGQVWYVDGDLDGFKGPKYNLCNRPTNGFHITEFVGEIDCNDEDPVELPGQVWYTDEDTDGFRSPNIIDCHRPEGALAFKEIVEELDCDDEDPDAFPYQEWVNDSDGDGYYNLPTFVTCERAEGRIPLSEMLGIGDCNDHDSTVYQSSPLVKSTDGGQWSSSGIWDCTVPQQSTTQIQINHEIQVLSNITISADIYIDENGTLIIGSGFTLILGSSLDPAILSNLNSIIIEAGGKLIIHGQLINDPDAVFINLGELEIH